MILYGGRQVERGLKNKIFKKPRHPYTKMLLGSDTSELKKMQPESNYLGCNFYCNCKYRSNLCQKSMPEEIEIEEGHYVSCHIFR